ncbi:hypothetical protein BGZ94_010198 [Podila epigama]|nr:hypothetical protein BGZ94_010198 [Podila epigama]
MLRAEQTSRNQYKRETAVAHFGTSPTSTTTSSSSLSTKEQRSKQLQILQQQQRESQQYHQLHQPYSNQVHSFSNCPMRLLSDETPPDDLDGSWGLDHLDMEDDHLQSQKSEQQQPQQDHRPSFNDIRKSPLYEQNDRNIAKNNDIRTPSPRQHTQHIHTNTHNDYSTIQSRNSPISTVNVRSVLVKGPRDGSPSTAQTFSPQRLQKGKAASEITRSALSHHKNDTKDESFCSSNSLDRSTFIRKSPDLPYDSDKFNNNNDINANTNNTSNKSNNHTDNSKFPWRDSKLDNIFTDLLKEEDPVAISGRSSSQLTARPHALQQSAMANLNAEPQEEGELDHSSTSSSSLSFGDIMDALNNGEESFDQRTSSSRKSTAKQTKLEQAKQRFVDLMPAASVESNRELTVSPTSSVKQEPMSLGSTPRNSYRHLKPSLNTPGPYQTSWAARHTRSSYRRSMGSRDSEIGDRGSTTSRDSLSGSTLGSIGFHAQADGLKKVELANVLMTFKSAMANPSGAILLSDGIKHSALSSTAQLRNDTTLAPEFPTPSTVDQILVEDTDATPRPKERVAQPPHAAGERTVTRFSPTPASKRFNPESDPIRASQFAKLADRGITKQSSSFVEELANATDTALRSATDIAVKLSSSPPKDKVAEYVLRGSSPLKMETDQSLSEALELEATDETLTRNRRGEKMHFIGHDEDEDLDDLGSLAGSKGIENAFKSLECLDMSFDMTSTKEYPEQEPNSLMKRRSSDIETGLDDNFLTLVRLPSKPKRKGEHSLKWEDQVDNTSESSRTAWKATSGRLSRSSSKSTVHNSSTMMPEESSFSHAEGHLIRHITALHPWEEWDQVKSLDLSKKEVESTINLNHLVPNLEVLLLNENEMSHLTGIPKTVKTLQARSNVLSDLTSFTHLVNLQYLDISHNGIEHLTGLSSLVHLRELNVSHNKVQSVSALQQMDGLIRLDVSHNCLAGLDFRWSRLQRLEFLNASHNKIEQLENLESLSGLIHANLAHNCIEDISLVQPISRLRILRLSENRLLTFNALSFPGLRTLYLDDNRLQSLENCQTLTRLENFSARDQEGEGIAIDMTDFINSRKLYLSGNPIHALDFNMGFYRMEYLEICAGCLSELPIDFAALMPNLRGLNLSYNGLDSIAALDGLLRLRRLIFVGNNLKSFSDVLSLVKRMRSLVALDLRHNPLTSNMYPAMSVKQGSKYQDTYRTNQNSETELDWRRRDIGFRRALPDAMYVKRSVYRSAIIKSCKRLEWFDGGVIQVKERERVPIVLGDLLDSYGHNYLSRREEDEEDWEYGPNDIDEYQASTHQYQDRDHGEQQHGFVYDREQLTRFAHENQEDDEEQDEEVDERDQEYYRDHDPEDITDHSKRHTASSVDNESLAGRERLRQQQIQLARQAAPKSPSASSGKRASSMQARRLLSSKSEALMVSPSPRVMGTMSRSNTGTTAQSLRSNHISKGAEQEEEEEEEEEEQQRTGEPLESADRRSAVKSWRDDVNEASLRKLQSPRTGSTTPGALRHSQLLPRADTAASVRSVQSGGSKHSGSGQSRHSNSGHDETAMNTHHNAQELTGMMSTMAVANDSTDQRHRHVEIPLPTDVLPFPRPQSFQQRGRPGHARGRSDGGENLAVMMTPGSTPRRQGKRPQSLHRLSSSYMTGEMTSSPMQRPTYVQQQQQQQQRLHFSMSPMGVAVDPQGGSRPTHIRRRSMGVYRYPSSSSLLASGRKRELTGEMISPSEALHMSELATPTGGMASSPGYFGMNHHQSHGLHHSHHGQGLIQSPYGFGKSYVHSGRSVPNTPSKSGRASRVSQGGYSSQVLLGTPQCQTLARDMERSTIQD